MVATRGRTFKRPWRRSCLSSKLKSSSAPIGRKDSWCFHAVGSSNAPLLGSTAAEGLPRIGRTSIATHWRSCGLPQSALCSENFVIPPDVFGQTLKLRTSKCFPLCPESDRIDTPKQLSESLCNRTCNCRTRSSSGCASCPATGKEASKQRSRSQLQRLYRHLAELDRALAELQREWSFGMQAAAGARGLLAVERDGKVAALGRNLHSAPVATGLGHRVDLGVIDDGAGAVARIGARVVDVALVAGFGAGLFGVFAADEDAAVGIIADPELGIDLEVFVFVLRNQKGGGLWVLLVLGHDRAVLDRKIGVAVALPVIKVLAVEERDPALAGLGLRRTGHRT